MQLVHKIVTEKRYFNLIMLIKLKINKFRFCFMIKHSKLN